MKMRFPILVLAIFVAGSGLLWLLGPGYAQESAGSPSQPFWPASLANFPQSGGGCGGGWGWGYRHASTAEEGVMRGMAAIMEAQGARNLMNAQALGLREDARRKYLDNRLFRTHTYFAMRQYNRQARDAARSPRATADDLERLARSQAPQRLNAIQLNPARGAIAWPANFRDAQYESSRKTLERLYYGLAKTGSLTGEQHAQSLQAIEAMDADLKKNISSYAPMNYIALSSFLDGLKYEFVVPAVPDSELVSVVHR
ncbi:MAG: hypothetical protein EA424_11870 [Planctomycetaceae bacterium]|nr:MAG: hypothetical protein EA424_11870 [Planctomycetaceae bacterium]